MPIEDDFQFLPEAGGGLIVYTGRDDQVWTLREFYSCACEWADKVENMDEEMPLVASGGVDGLVVIRVRERWQVDPNVPMHLSMGVFVYDEQAWSDYQVIQTHEHLMPPQGILGRILDRLSQG